MKTADRQGALPLFGHGAVTGIDEAGRGPLAGPVVAAAVTLPAGLRLPRLADSKTLAVNTRLELAEEIRQVATSWAVAWADPAEIDVLNILNATMLAMRRAVAGLATPPGHALVDGNRCPRLPCTVEAVIGGDASVPAISAASILAKTVRDAIMAGLDDRYPGYGFAGHKGYPTRAHVDRLRRLGPSPVHRRTFRPVAVLLGAA